MLAPSSFRKARLHRFKGIKPNIRRRKRIVMVVVHSATMVAEQAVGFPRKRREPTMVAHSATTNVLFKYLYRDASNYNGRRLRDHKQNGEAIGWTVFFRRPKAYAYEGDPIFRSERQVRRHFRQTFVPEVEDDLMLFHHLTACKHGQPITREAAITVLQQIFDHLDSSQGISWTTIEVALEDYYLDLSSLTAEQHAQVAGAFKVWDESEENNQTFGGQGMESPTGHFPEALAYAIGLAKQNPGQPVTIGCVPMLSYLEVVPCLMVLQKAGQDTPTITTILLLPQESESE